MVTGGVAWTLALGSRARPASCPPPSAKQAFGTVGWAPGAQALHLGHWG